MNNLKSIKRIVVLALLLVMLIPYGANAQNSSFTKVGENDSGVESKQPFLVKGDNYKLPDEFKGSKEAMTCNFGGSVIYAFDGVDKEAQYQLEVVFLADRDRTQTIVADGDIIHGPIVLKKGEEQRYIIDLPMKSYAYGQLVLVFEEVRGASNAIVSEINVYSSNPKPLVAFEGANKEALTHTQAYIVDTNVDPETVLPNYTPYPQKVEGVYTAQMSLNGMWRFNEKAILNFEKSQANGSDWHPIVVPGQWSMQGFAVDSAGFAAYQRNFIIPKDWSGKRIKLRFDGVSSESEIYVNSTKVGDHMGGMTAFELDVTDALVAGENRLSVKVRSESLADMLGSLTQYAAHQIGGITRKVTLFAVPEVYVSDVRIETSFDKEYKDAKLKTYVTVTNTTGKIQKGYSVRLSLEGLPVVIETKLPDLKANEVWKGWLEGDVKEPLQWDNEHPNLYTMKLDLSKSNVISEQIAKKFGFREILVDGAQVLVNGKAVKLRGVCRHEVHPLTGRVMTADLQRKDVELYRAGNNNFIRTSHYPPGEELLEICDELGMFVEVESPVCWMGHHANENWKVLNYRDEKYYDYVLQANMETIHFYRNHPSVIFWSVANESYWNKGFAQVLEYVKKADTTRPSAFHDQGYGGFNNQGSTTAIANIHYPGPNGHLRAEKQDRPMVYGEYCHLNVYNRSELVTDPGVRSDWALALQEVWENMYKTKEVLGGSIWSGIDDVFQLPNGDAVGYGEWGPIDGWRRPKPEYWDMKKIYSPIRVATTELQPAKRLVLDVENRYTYTNLNEVKIDWRYGREQGTLLIDVKPQGTGKMTIDIANPSLANELYISFTDPRGFVADEYVIPVGKQVQNELAELKAVATKLKTSKGEYIISGDKFQATISRTTGQIVSMKRNGKEIINGGPWLMALELTGGGCYPNHNAETPVFNDICTEWTMQSIDAKKVGENVEVKVTGKYVEFEGEYTLVINANGEFSVQYTFNSLEDVNPRQWGLVFESPKQFDKTFWRRDGLWTVYPDDHISRPAGEAKLFYDGLPDKINPRVEPTWAWSFDFNQLGSSDFRSTRRNIWFAGLENASNAKLTVKSDGKQGWRSWLEGDKIRFLVADFVTPGAEMFLGSYYNKLREPIKVGDTITGEITVRVE